MADDLNLIENEEEIITEETIEIISADSTETVVIEASEAFPALGEDNDEMNHAKLYGRDFPDQHPISAITGLQEKFDAIDALKTIYSDEKQHADYYKWSDANPRRENRNGLFVSICPETTDIQICNNEQDVFGVTVAEAGFIGGQEYINTVDNVKVGRDRTYGLVAHSGLVSVRRETSVKVGDYVVPNVRGEAKRAQKTDDTNYYYGYLVVGLSEVDGIKYASILLGAPSALSQRIADCVDSLYGRMNVAEYNIASTINVVNSAYELARDAKENSSSSAEYVACQMGAMSDKLEASDQMMQTMSTSVQGACESAAMAQVIASNAVKASEAMRGEVAALTQETLTEMSKTRQEVDQKILDINIELDHIGLDLQATNESINATKNGMQDSIDDIVKDLEKLGQDLTPLTAWPNETNPSGIAGFVAQSNADSATLASITKFEGEFGESIAGFVQEATKDNATVSAIASYQQKDADGNPYGPSGASVLMSQVDANAASINLLAELEGDGFTGLAGLTAKVDENSSSISTLASHVIGEFENTDDWTEEGKDTAKVYYAKNSRLYYYYSPVDGIWYSTSKSYEANLSGAISGVQSVVDAKSSEIDALAIWQTGAAESIASIEQKADQNVADISLLASWKSEVESDVSSIATIKSTADTNKASIEELVKKDTELSTTIAGVKTTADANKASIESITSWQSTVNPTINSVASIEQKANDNAAEIEALTSWQGTTNVAMAGLKQQADDNGAKIEACVANIAKYAVGEHSQAYGLLRNQAREILTPDMVYVPTIKCSETYGGDTPYTQEFIKGYYYTWNTTQLKWDVSLVPGVNFSRVYIIGTETTPYWVVTDADVEQDGALYDLGGLYLWKDGSWTKVAAMADNTLSRAVSQIKQTANEIEAAVDNVKGDVAGIDIRVGNNETSLQTVTSWKSTVEDDVSKIATIEQKANDASTSVALVVSEKNGDKMINTSSIVASINNGNSDVLIEADRIQLAGDVTIASWRDPDDQTKIRGSNIATGTVTAQQINVESLIASGSLAVKSDIPDEDDITTITNKTISTTEVVAENLKVKAANIEDKLTADQIVADNLHVKSADVADKLNVTQLSAITGNMGTLNAGCIQSNSHGYNTSKVDIWKPYSTGLAYTLNGSFYDVSGIGTCADLDVIIPPTYNGVRVYRIAKDAFAYSSITGVVVPSSIGFIETRAFQNCRKLKKVEIQGNKTAIGLNAFYGCSNLEYVNIPESALYVSEGAFYGCSKLKNIRLPSTMDDIDSNTFKSCSSLTHIDMPDSITAIRADAFASCTRLTSVIIPNAVTMIAARAFQYCSGLTFVVIPKSVTQIGANAFSGCSKLTSVYYYGTEEEWNAITIADGNDALTSAARYYYSGSRPTTGTNFWRPIENVEGFQISASSDNMIDSKYFKVSQDGKITATEVVIDGDITSSNANITGIINATSGTIGGLSIQNNEISSGSLTFKPNGLIVAQQLEIIDYFKANDLRIGKISGRSNANAYFDFEGVSRDERTVTASVTAVVTDYGDAGIFGLGHKGGNVDFTITTSTPLMTSRTFILQLTYFNSIQGEITKALYGTIPSDSNTVTVSTVYRVLEGNTSYYCLKDSTGISPKSFTDRAPSSLVSIISGGSIVPEEGKSFNLGSTSARWDKLFINTGYLKDEIIITSDVNKKNTIEAIDNRYTDLFDSLRPVTYKLNDGDSGRKHIGLIANEVKESLDVLGIDSNDFAAYCSWEDSDGSQTCGIRYGELISLNIDETQKLKKRVSELENIIKELTTKQND